jgi:hypothetical protein
LNHLLHFYRRQVPLPSYLQLLSLVPALEVRNGTMLALHNGLVERVWQEGTGALACVAGSDAHTLRRIGRTWTEAPGTTAAEFLAAITAGLGRPGGTHGTAATVAGDTYGVVGRYIASVWGYGPHDHHGWHRIGCSAFIALTAPAQFLPVVIAAIGKSRERKVVDAAIETLAAMPDLSTPWPRAAAESQL